MAKTLKPYEVPLEADLAREVLNTPLESTSGGSAPRTIGERVKVAVQAVDEANEYLAHSQLAAILADSVMRQLKKRGNPSIRVRPDGTVILHVAYDEDPQARGEPPVRRTSRKSNLPKISELRKRAEAAAVDISDLGRQRRAIYDRVKKAEDAVATKKPEVVLRRQAPSTPTDGGEPGSDPSLDIDIDDLLEGSGG
jgi:hypothetical protein